MLAIDEPLSTNPSKPALYRVADSNLRLFLAASRAAQELARRGRPEAAFLLLQRRWSSWRGRAVEPLVRQSLELAAASGSLPWPDVEVVGGWWNRQFDPEVDLVGADRVPVARRIDFVGSVKWLEARFDEHDFAALRRGAEYVPGFAADAGGFVVVSLSGIVRGVDLGDAGLVWGPGDVVSAWRSTG